MPYPRLCASRLLSMLLNKNKGHLMSPIQMHTAAIWVIFMLSSCASVEVTTKEVPVDTNTPPPLLREKTPPPYIGLALSGGGNRSALYSSYVIDLLSALPVRAMAPTRQYSFMDTVQYISSVSGGGFAASYYSTKRDASLNGPDWNATKQSFYSQFHSKMNENWEAAIGWRLFATIFTRTPIELLERSLESDFLKGETFGSLAQKEASGRSPVMIFNATHYDTGRKFVMSTLPTATFKLRTDKLIIDILELKERKAKLSLLDQSSLSARMFSNIERSTYAESFHEATPELLNTLVPEGFDAIQGPGSASLDYEDMPLSLAVASSGAFPGLGPLPLTVKAPNGNVLDYTYVHLIDGGVTDNSGVESLAQIFLRDLISPYTNKVSGTEKSPITENMDYALIIKVDASLPFRESSPAFKNRTTPLWTILADPGQPSDIQEERTNFYRKSLWHFAGGNTNMVAGTPDNPISRMKIIEFRHTDLSDADQVGALALEGAPRRIKDRIQPKGCRVPLSREDAQRRLSEVSTRYHLSDECDVSWLRISACSSVLKHAPNIQRFYQLADGKASEYALDNLYERTRMLCPEMFSES
ncbi:hypothetical protein CBM2633_P30013 [Cupriavidus taiwanensis]|uniref:PNPLA domain-containing protein n=5 Tax=Burkholderiaceae TaxID=119060 RepID=A0A375DBQ2_9BURK|nr:patatin-like phospholipase family protein [Cupriavidus taiwanensis]SOZ40583.1 hypothetical protein CBM2605_P30013 [Cupriavidus neocaledonicus]CAP63728.1 hypothetical protein pRALTA_0023 [Cupriavidus taiwanensis LMG 19424]SOY75428.1 hypothetical protein CBM2592_P30012 [Cupriavidus taiwanensis]SOY75430.1 hypothetical protein CBM2588_P30012 [Cupriavidus taiwanensis]SOY75750.1 hypothetical protein CBM2585_P30013 [Cupriavidus taiwanensis]